MSAPLLTLQGLGNATEYFRTADQAVASKGMLGTRRFRIEGMVDPGLHTVGRKVRFTERPTILPPELYERFSGRNFWRRPGGNPRGVEVILPSAPKDGPRRPMQPNPGMNQGGRMAMGRMRPPAGA